MSSFRWPKKEVAALAAHSELWTGPFASASYQEPIALVAFHWAHSIVSIL